MLASASAWDPTAGKLTSVYRGCSGIGDGEKEADHKGAGGTPKGYKTPIF